MATVQSNTVTVTPAAAPQVVLAQPNPVIPVVLNWTAPAGETTNEIWRSSDGGSSYFKMGNAGAGARSYTDSGNAGAGYSTPANGTTYKYRVDAIYP
jgi:hypothetical protein